MKVLRNQNLEWQEQSIKSLSVLDKQDVDEIVGIDLSEETEAVNDNEVKKLAVLTNLRKLFLVDADITNLEFLSSLTKLEEIDISGTGVTHLSALSKLENLNRLDANDVPLRDISPLKGLNRLKILNIERTNLKDVSPLSEIRSLEEVDLEGCQNVDDITLFKKLENLKKLDVKGTMIVYADQLNCLENLSHLEELTVNSEIEFAVKLVLKTISENRKKSTPTLSRLLSALSIHSTESHSKEESIVDSINFRNDLKALLSNYGINVKNQDPLKYLVSLCKTMNDFSLLPSSPILSQKKITTEK